MVVIRQPLRAVVAPALWCRGWGGIYLRADDIVFGARPFADARLAGMSVNLRSGRDPGVSMPLAVCVERCRPWSRRGQVPTVAIRDDVGGIPRRRNDGSGGRRVDGRRVVDQIAPSGRSLGRRYAVGIDDERLNGRRVQDAEFLNASVGAQLGGGWRVPYPDISQLRSADYHKRPAWCGRRRVRRPNGRCRGCVG